MVAPGKLFWKFFLGNSLIIAAVLATCFWLMIHSMQTTRNSEVSRRLRADAKTLQQLLGPLLHSPDSAALNQIVRQLTAGSVEHIRITAILPDGRVLADSEAEPGSMEPHGDRKEVRDALQRGLGEDSRISHTLAQQMHYVAVRVGPPDQPTGVLRVAMSQGMLDEQNRMNLRLLWTIAAVGLLASLALALGLARLWSRPIKLITRTARSISQGDLSARVNISSSDELGVLAHSLNEMRDHLASQLDMLDGQRRTLQSLLAQLHEGVVVADANGCIVLLNPSAIRVLGIPQSAGPARSLEGRPVEECILEQNLRNLLLVRHHPQRPGDLEDTIEEVRIDRQTDGGGMSLLARASDIILPRTGETATVECSSPPMPGRLLVLTDVTELTRMIQIKADFAANASHELRTPLSAVRAAVETLLQIDPQKDAESARHFLGVVDRHSGRLEAIVNDLLNLSKIESSPSLFQTGTVDVNDLVAELRARFEERMEAKDLKWEINRPALLNAMNGNLRLLRLVLDNLIDNAIKFTDAGGLIGLSFRDHRTDEPAVAVEVSDTGCGIPVDEQARVFERFYQVERARSGTATRGTGLGLSIVRHAVAAMRGTVELHSQPGQGTTITFSIPQSRRGEPSGNPMDQNLFRDL